jgi:hypothetical protein
MEQRRQPQNEPTAAGSGRVNVVLLIGGTLLASAVFAGVAEGEGLPVVLGAMLPWLVIVAAATWWLASMQRARRAHLRASAESMTRARTAAVDVLLADAASAPERLQAAELVLAPEPKATQAEPFFEMKRRDDRRELR